MFGKASVTAAATASSVGIWAGSSPVPRQQYQRNSTGSPDATLALGSTALALALGAPADDPAGVAVAPPQAAAMRMVAVSAARRLIRLRSMIDPPWLVPRFPALLAMAPPSPDAERPIHSCTGAGSGAARSGAFDRAIDVVAGSIPAHEGPSEFNRHTGRVERDSF